MKFTPASILALVAVASAVVVETPEQSVDRREVRLMERAGVNGDRKPCPQRCLLRCNTSFKEDVCRVNNQNGRCISESVNNCGERLTCIEDSRLTCNPNVLERGRPKCVLKKKQA